MSLNIDKNKIDYRKTETHFCDTCASTEFNLLGTTENQVIFSIL